MLIIIKDFVFMYFALGSCEKMCDFCVLAFSVKKRKEKKREFGFNTLKIGIGLIRVGRHSGWMFSGLMAF